MKLRYITCSDPRENISVESILNFAEKYPISEFGIQAYRGSMSYSQAKNMWFNRLMNVSGNMPCPPNIALHINYEWCDCMCSGVIPYEVNTWIDMINTYTKEPVIKRIQLNIGDYAYDFYTKRLAQIIAEHPNQEFIFPYNVIVADKISALKKTGAKFSLLFDDSYGAGIEPKRWRKPVYKNVPHGYSGGLGPKNVTKNLNKINSILPPDYETWIDAEGKLRGNTKKKMFFTLELAEKYMKNALAWAKTHTK